MTVVTFIFLKKDKTLFAINDANQISNKGYLYSLNGNLIADPSRTYRYDALNRLIATGNRRFQYDGFDKCVKVNSSILLYLNNQEIGCYENNALKELRIIDPSRHKTYVIELDQTPYFPIQNHRGDVCALYNTKGKLVQWFRYNTFGTYTLFGDTSINAPWRYANRREVDGLVLYHYRIYNPAMMRWLTQDPLGFTESLNRYRFNRNNPNRYIDSDGRFACAYPAFMFVVEFFSIAFGPTAATTACTITATEVAATATVVLAGRSA